MLVPLATKRLKTLRAKKMTARMTTMAATAAPVIFSALIWAVPDKGVHDRPGGHPPASSRLFELIPETG